MWSGNYIRIPFKEHGRDRIGCDCWGLVSIVYKERLGIILPSLLDYKSIKDDPAIVKLMREEKKKWVEIPLGSEREYDVGVFKMMGFPTHVGLVLGFGNMIHTEEGKGVHINNYVKEQLWVRSLVGFYRHATRSNISPSV